MGGPKYSLPSTVGRERHDGRKKQAPAFSFGTRHAKFSSDCSPGPGAYSIVPSTTRRGGDGTPKYSLYGRHKELRPFSTPGPGQYSPEQAGKSAYYSAPTYSLSGRTKGHKSDQSPGPAAYSLNPMLGIHVLTKGSAPAYSMTARATVGSSLIKSRGPSYSMIGRNLMPTDSTRKPGPGAHSPESVNLNKKSHPTFSFGITHSDYCSPLILPVDNRF